MFSPDSQFYNSHSNLTGSTKSNLNTAKSPNSLNPGFGLTANSFN